MTDSQDTTLISDTQSVYDWSWAFVHYKPIVGHSKILVGSDGSTWYFKRLKSGSLYRKNFHQKTNKAGYKTVEWQVQNKMYYRYVHRLVLELFVGPCPEGMECRHLDGRRFNNGVWNLKWGTHVENCLDQIRHGTFRTGEKCSYAKLNEETVRYLIANQDTLNAIEIAEILHVAEGTVRRAVSGACWKHLQPTRENPENRLSLMKLQSGMTQEKIDDIRSSFQAGETGRSIAKRLNVSTGQVSRIVNYQCWSKR